MPEVNYTLPTVGNPNSTEDPLVRTALSDLKTWANGALSSGAFGSALAQQVGTGARRASIDVAAEFSTSSTTAVDVTNASTTITLPSSGPAIIVYGITLDMKITGSSGGLYYLYAGSDLLPSPTSTTSTATTSSTTYVTSRTGGTILVNGTGSVTLKWQAKASGTDTAYIKNIKTLAIAFGT